MAKRNRHNKSLRERMIEEMLPLLEKSNLAEWLESRLHMELTRIADEMFGNGNVTRDERKILSGAIGVALDSYHNFLQENGAQLFQRRPWDDAPEAVDGGSAVSEAEDADDDGIELTESGARSMFVPLIEKAVRSDGTIPVKIIRPGWGSSGYYPAEVLERDGPKVFQRGTKMYWNHQTPSEEAERPEGDLNALAAELVTNARYQANGPAGAGLYADAKVFETYKTPVDDLAPHIGVSIRAFGKAQHGAMEGREGAIITELTKAKSVDFVTAPGAGGQILSLFEAARSLTPPPTPPHRSTDGEGGGSGSAVQNSTRSGDLESNPMKEARMDELELKKLQEANATLQTNLDEVKANNARMQEALALRDAKDIVREALAASTMPDVTKARLLEALSANPPMKDGALDGATLKTRIEEAVKAEAKYLEQVAGVGKIRGLGESQNEDDEYGTPEKLEESLAESFAALDLSEAGAKIAAKGRV
ncbi:MAG: hypothetical protein C4583_04330 [Anaerolineaceae bacterium]|nr:MAG: hypothetical protein C4583_04330 [Anaerolineaceae bacterium]